MANYRNHLLKVGVVLIAGIFVLFYYVPTSKTNGVKTQSNYDHMVSKQMSAPQPIYQGAPENSKKHTIPSSVNSAHVSSENENPSSVNSAHVSSENENPSSVNSAHVSSENENPSSVNSAHVSSQNENPSSVYNAHNIRLDDSKSLDEDHDEVHLFAEHPNIPKRPNILYLLADDLGYGDVEYNGGKARTPNLNAMAKGPHSIHLTRFYAGGPVCSPTRGTILTGRNHNRYCIWHADIGVPCSDGECPSLMPLPPSEITLPEILQREGYQTAIIGKWHVGDLQEIPGGNKKWPVSHPGMHGFDEWLVTERDTFSVTPNCLCYDRMSCTVGNRHYDHRFCRDYKYMDVETNTLRSYNDTIVGDSDFIVDRFESFLLRRSDAGEKPFFVMLSFHDVHRVFLAMDPYYTEYKKKGYPPDIVDFYGSVSQLDEAIGKVRSLLVKYGVRDNTLLLFSSDNGPQRGTPGSSGGLKGGKGDVWEGGIRVPAIIEWPSVIKENRVSDFPVVTSDLLPTVCDILGIDPPKDRPIDGTSILPFLMNETNHTRNKSLAFAFHIKKGSLQADFHVALMRDRYKLIIHFKNGKVQDKQFYDIVADPHETKHIASIHGELVTTMKQELEDFVQSVTQSATDIGCISTHDRREPIAIKKCSCPPH